MEPRPDSPLYAYRTWRDLHDIEHPDGGGECLADLLASLTESVLFAREANAALQARIDALTLRLYGEPDSGGTDGGEVGRLQRDVETLFDDNPTLLPRAANQPHRRTTDEQSTYAVATS